jgi:hypothetical protein
VLLGRPEVVTMLKTAALMLTLIGLALVALVDRDGRIAGGDLVARGLGFVVRVELTVQRNDRRTEATAVAVLPDRCTLVADSATRVVVWR